MSVNTYSRKDFKVGQVLYGLTRGTIKQVKRAVSENCDISWDELVSGIEIEESPVTITKVGTVYLTVMKEGRWYEQRFTLGDLYREYSRDDNTLVRLFETHDDVIYSLRELLLKEKIQKKLYKYDRQFRKGLEVANGAILDMYLNMVEDIIKQGEEYLNNR